MGTPQKEMHMMNTILYATKIQNKKARNLQPKNLAIYASVVMWPISKNNVHTA